jgi:KipI family sensor histidine kinase inhibitor
VVEAIPGMNNITVVLRNPHTLALDAIERLQRWWEESEALEPESRAIEIPVVYGGRGAGSGVAQHCGLTEKQVVELHSLGDYVVWFLDSSPDSRIWADYLPAAYAAPRRTAPERPGGDGGYWRRADRHLSAGFARWLAAYWAYRHAVI